MRQRYSTAQPENRRSRRWHLDRVDHLIGQLQGIALARKRQPPVVGERLPWQPFNEVPHSQFSNVTVHNYRGIDGGALEDLRRVNLVVGLNNAGKTSVLEAIYLLAYQNDERAVLDVIRWWGRMEGEPDPGWLVEQLPTVVRISDRFDKTRSNAASIDIKLAHEPGENIRNQTLFLSTANTRRYPSSNLSSKAHRVIPCSF